MNSIILHFVTIAALLQLALARPSSDSEPDNLLFEEEVKFPGASVKGPFTAHFSEWLIDNDFHIYNFTLPELGSQASFGGKQFAEQKLTRPPVIFIHGNSDGALADGKDEWAQGWSASIEHFISKGYTTAELYAVTYGDRILANSLKRSVNCHTLVRLRRFLEAVIAYTGADKVDIIAHSMGVTLARHIIQGRSFEELKKGSNLDPELDECYLGPSLRDKVQTLVGIAGANFGLCLCSDPKLAEMAPACSKKTGFWAASGCEDAPIDECHLPHPVPHRAHCHYGGQYATMLSMLNEPEKPKDAHFIASLWSEGDALLGSTNIAWGHLTSLIPLSDRQEIYQNHSHYSIKWATVEDQFNFVSLAAQKREAGNESVKKEAKKDGTKP